LISRNNVKLLARIYKKWLLIREPFSIYSYAISAFKSIIFLAATQPGQSQNSAPSALMSLACCNRLAAPSSPRICVASSEPAKPIVSSISAMFCSATDTSCFVSSSCLGVPSALIQD